MRVCVCERERERERHITVETVVLIAACVLQIFNIIQDYLFSTFYIVFF